MTRGRRVIGLLAVPLLLAVYAGVRVSVELTPWLTLTDLTLAVVALALLTWCVVSGFFRENAVRKHANRWALGFFALLVFALASGLLAFGGFSMAHAGELTSSERIGLMHYGGFVIPAFVGAVVLGQQGRAFASQLLGRRASRSSLRRGRLSPLAGEAAVRTAPLDYRHGGEAYAPTLAALAAELGVRAPELLVTLARGRVRVRRRTGRRTLVIDAADAARVTLGELTLETDDPLLALEAAHVLGGLFGAHLLELEGEPPLAVDGRALDALVEEQLGHMQARLERASADLEVLARRTRGEPPPFALTGGEGPDRPRPRRRSE